MCYIDERNLDNLYLKTMHNKHHYKCQDITINVLHR